jgi:20S proteasome alpha/beta subunit
VKISLYIYAQLQVVAGLAADGRQIVSRAKSEAASYEK